ncbi:MAG: hypothetical protein HQM02_08855 [Magnetococcales bacterium]|nr:hypothetical protein [Magnetococcales bacterium]
MLQWLGRHTDAMLFTGGDLTGRLPLFHRAIRSLERVRSFGILLNGSCASSPEAARLLLDHLQAANDQRSRPAEIVLQVSFDEYHQEIVPDRDGTLRERIPVDNITHLILAAVAFPAIQLVLLHKQNRLNFSTDLFKRGLFARLARALRQRGHALQILWHACSPRIKTDPVDHRRSGPVIRDALFALAAHPERPMRFSSSIIDGHGRAALLDPSEFINERHYLQEILRKGAPARERFDTDPMFAIDGAVSCFAANHLWLGNFHEEGGTTILERHDKDPLLSALERFDPRLTGFYQEVANDLEEILNSATGPHHFMHRLTERAEVRLHMTRRLLNGPA